MTTSLQGGRGIGTATGRAPISQSTGNIIPKGYEYGQIGQFTPEQMNLFQQLFGHVGEGSFLSRLAGGDESLFQEMERPALRQFGQLQGNIASRFSGMGSGARRSSGFQNVQSGAASELAESLQGQRQQLQRQALMDLMGISESLLGQRPYDQFLIKKEKKPSFLQSLLGGLSGGIGQGLGIGSTLLGKNLFNRGRSYEMNPDYDFEGYY